MKPSPLDFTLTGGQRRRRFRVDLIVWIVILVPLVAAVIVASTR